MTRGLLSCQVDVLSIVSLVLEVLPSHHLRAHASSWTVSQPAAVLRSHCLSTRHTHNGGLTAA